METRHKKPTGDLVKKSTASETEESVSQYISEFPSE